MFVKNNRNAAAFPQQKVGSSTTVFRVGPSYALGIPGGGSGGMEPQQAPLRFFGKAINGRRRNKTVMDKAIIEIGL